MSAIKYKKLFKTMVEDNSTFFTNFKQLHENYLQNPEEYKTKFKSEGEKLLRIIRRYENELCSKSENSGFGKYSLQLSEKFWEEVRNNYPYVDDISLL